MPRTETRISWAIAPDRRAEFVAKGHRDRHVFAHELRFFPKAGPDGYKLAVRMCGIVDPAAQWEIVLYAHPSLAAELPRELFFDDDLVWHQQQFGLDGQIATADVVLAGRDLWSIVHISDVVQRIGRRREHKTRIENRFRGWHDMLLNGLLAFAARQGVERIRLPRSPLALQNTDRKRNPHPELFERVYDRDVQRLFAVRADGDWWLLDVEENRARLVEPQRKVVEVDRGRRICLCHDVEAGLGHVRVDGALARAADREWRRSLARMLEVERALGVRATYNVVGVLLEEIRAEIEAGGHCVAFHSYDHDELTEQLERCRELDYRIKGYRVPRSRLTPELGEERLLLHNFEWLASSRRSLGVQEPFLRNGLVRVPVLFDDHHLYRDGLEFDAWQATALETASASEVAVFSLHDCYGPLWLDGYAPFVEHVATLGELLTVDELAAEITLTAAI